jgi:cysteine synthase A
MAPRYATVSGNEMKRLARSHGLFCGPSSGAHMLAAKRIRQNFPELKTVVTAFCDEGEKYLHEYFMLTDATGVDATHFR